MYGTSVGLLLSMAAVTWVTAVCGDQPRGHHNTDAMKNWQESPLLQASSSTIDEEGKINTKLASESSHSTSVQDKDVPRPRSENGQRSSRLPSNHGAITKLSSLRLQHEASTQDWSSQERLLKLEALNQGSKAAELGCFHSGGGCSDQGSGRPNKGLLMPLLINAATHVDMSEISHHEMAGQADNSRHLARNEYVPVPNFYGHTKHGHSVQLQRQAMAFLLPSQERPGQASSPVGGVNGANIDLSMAAGHENSLSASAAAANTYHQATTTYGGFHQKLESLLGPLRNEIGSGVRVPFVAGPHGPFANEARANREDMRAKSSSLRLMNVLKPPNPDQLHRALPKSDSGSGQREAYKQSGFIIMSNMPHLPGAQTANVADWVRAVQVTPQQTMAIDPPPERKTSPKSRLRKREAGEEEEEEEEAKASHSLTLDQPKTGLTSHSLENKTSAAAAAAAALPPANEHGLQEAKVPENANLSDTKLSYRFRGMVGLVDDSRLPIKHLDNSGDTDEDEAKGNPRTPPQLPITNVSNDDEGPYGAARNHSYLLPISEPINATKAVGQSEAASGVAEPTPSVRPASTANDQGLQGPPKPEQQEDYTGPDTDPESESNQEFDFDIAVPPEQEGVDSEPEVEPEGESEPEVEPEGESEPEVEPEDNADMEPEGEGEGTLGEPEVETGDVENETGEYLGHVDVEPVDAEPEPEMEPTAEPEGPDQDSGCVSQCYAEPTPEWEKARDVWKSAWEIHVFGFGIVYSVLALYSCVSIIRLWQKRNLLSQGYFISLNAMLLVLCTSRAIILLVDGYNSQGTFHPVLAYLLYTIGFPCLTSAFSILFLALLKTMKMQLLSARIQKPQVLIGVICFHFSLSLSVDMILGYFYDGRVTSMVCQVASLLWGASLSIGYMYVFRRLFVSAIRRQKEMARISSSMNNLGTHSVEKKQPKLMLNIAIKVTLITAFLGFLLVCIHIYGMVEVINVFSKDIPDPWPWWGLHFGLRLTEIGMCITMSYVATQPFRYHQQTPLKESGGYTSQCWDMLYLVPCHRLCMYQGQEGEEEQAVHQLQMTTHQDSLVHSDSHMGYCNVNLNKDVEENTYVITETPDLNDKRQNTENNLFGAVPMAADNDVEKPGGRAKRPPSMLIKEDGLIRFRQEWDPMGDPIGSTDDDLDGSSSVILDNGYLHTSNGERLVAENDPGHYHRHFAKYYQAHRNGRVPSQSDKEGNVSTTGQYHSVSVPNTGANTPATPRSFCSTDADVMSEVFSFRPPSSIHLRDSIEGALDYSSFSLKSPDYYGTLESFALPKTPEELGEGQVYPKEYHQKRKYSETDLAYRCRLKRGSSVISRASKRSCQSDRKTPDLPWVHKSPKQYWDKIKSKGSSVSLSMASPYGSGYSPLDDNDEQFTVADVRNYLMRSSLYRSNSDSLTHIKYENYEHGTDV